MNEEKEDNRFVIFTLKHEDVKSRGSCYSMIYITRWYVRNYPDGANDHEDDMVDTFIRERLSKFQTGWVATKVGSLEIDGQHILPDSIKVQMVREDIGEDGLSVEDWEGHWLDVSANIDTEQLATQMSEMFKAYIVLDLEREADND